MTRYRPSNDWLVPIVEEARPVLDSFDRETAIEIAVAVLKKSDTQIVELPWATVFPSDDIESVARRLHEVLLTPDYQTPFYSADTVLAVDSLRNILRRHKVEGIFASHAAYSIVQSVAGTDESFFTYQDAARKWSQYGDDWLRKLSSQFGADVIDRMKQVNPELITLLELSQSLATMHERQLNLSQDGESHAALIKRTLEFLNVDSIDDLNEAAKVLEVGLDDYRGLSYRLRGLTVPKDL